MDELSEKELNNVQDDDVQNREDDDVQNRETVGDNDDQNNVDDFYDDILGGDNLELIENQSEAIIYRGHNAFVRFWLGFLRTIGKIFVWLGLYIAGIAIMLWNAIKAFPFKVWDGMKALGRGCQGLVYRFVHGDAITRSSYLIMGAGSLFRGQLKGILYLLYEIGFVLFMVFLGAPNLAKLPSMGVSTYYDDEWNLVPGDNSLTILMWSIVSIMLMITLIVLYANQTKVAYQNYKDVEAGKPLTTFKESFSNALNDKFHLTILLIPVLGIIILSILPLIMNILVAFTQYDQVHTPPGSVFKWVGLANFQQFFGANLNISYTFWNVLLWTLIWAVFATFTNYFAGMIVALVINKKSIKLKKMWRTFFVTTIAVPQFVSLMLMSKFLADEGPLNTILKDWGWMTTLREWGLTVQEGVTRPFVPFLSDTTWARCTVIIVNLWVGIPYTMLATTGILMNIPADLYESAKIDGASPVRQFISITLPYMLFITGPKLLTDFTGNINNFNLIFLLTGGGPSTSNYFSAGKTDLLITWLYRLTVDAQNYKIGSVLGILIFIIMSFFSLIIFNSTKGVKQEDTFQ